MSPAERILRATAVGGMIAAFTWIILTACGVHALLWGSVLLGFCLGFGGDLEKSNR